MDTVEFDYV